MDDKLKYLEKVLLHWEKSVMEYLPQLVLGIAVLILFIFLAKIARKISLKVHSKTAKNYPEIGRLVSSAIFFFFLFSGIFIALQVMGLAPVLTKLLAGAGIMGIIAGFAFKDVASNLFAGLLLKMQHPFKKGDWVEIDSVYGVVTEISWITTAIKTISGQKVFIPNQVIYSNSFTSYSAYHKRRIIFESGVSYGDDLELVKAAALEEVSQIEGLLPDEAIDFYFTEIGSYSYNFQLRFWIRFHNNNDYRIAMSQIIMRIKRRFEKENIDLAYPVTTLDFGVKGGVNIFDQDLRFSNDTPLNNNTPPPPIETAATGILPPKEQKE